MSVEEDVLVTSHGVVGGKMTVNRRKIKALKNGKKTAEEQAELTASRKWSGKLDDGYEPKVKSKEYLQIIKEKQLSGGNNHCLMEEGARKKPVKNATVPQDTYLPNLAHTWLFQPKCEKYFDFDKGVYAQPKLDGHRCVAHIENQDGEDVVFLTTRTGKQWSFLGNLRREIQTFLKGQEDIILDGELYNHDLSSIGINGDGERFAFLQSCCKTGRVSPHEKEDLVQFHVFDVIGEGDQKTRFTTLDALFENYEGELIKQVRTEKVHSKEEFLALYGSFIAEGYEGIMLRDNQLKYEQGKRSQRIRKHKEFYDSDFLIVDADKAEGNQEGCVVWICETEKGERFQTTMKGSLEFRREMYENREEHFGKMLKVRHQVPLAEIEEGCIPRFPVGLGVREDL